MAKLEFKDISFSIEDGSFNAAFYNLFYFQASLAEFNNEFTNAKIKEHSIEFSGNKSQAEKKFNFFLLKNMQFLKNKLNGRRAVYIHRNSGIPILGNISFGIVDRNSTLVEIKPITSCILDCIYCSIAEGKNDKAVDFFVECEYLIEEAENLVKFKGVKEIEFHINSQGEPLLYSRMLDLVKGLSSIKNVSKISIDTNGLLLDKVKIDELSAAGLTQFNISLNAISPSVAEKIAGKRGYDVLKVLENCRLIAKHNKLLLAPIFIPGVNNDEIPKIIEFGKELNAKIGVQNFLEYKQGNNPARQMEWDRFYDCLKDLERKYDVKLILDADSFNIRKSKELPNPFKEGEICEAMIICPGRYPNEVIVALRDRNVTVVSKRRSGKVRFKVVRNKHNIILGKEV